MKTNQNKNKIVVASAMAAALSVCLTATSAQAQSGSYNRNAPTVTVNSESVDFPGQQPVSQGGRVLVPLRGVLEKLGAYVQYDSAARVITALKGDLNIRLPIGGREATVNQRPVSLDVPAQVVNGSTLVPLRFVAESLGANVEYNPAANAVAITAGQVAGGTPQPAPGGGGLGQSETIVGTVVAVYADQTPQRMVLRPQGAGSANQTIPLANRVAVSLRRNGEDVPVTLARIDVGDRVSVRKNPRGVAQEISIVTRRQNAGGDRGENATTFTGRFDTYGESGTNRSVITTQDARTVTVPTNVPVVIDGRRVTLRELRSGDQITVTVNPNNGRGTRVVVNSRR
ncbi:MAG: copper amine oxidase N-terminal domain-containing protein [Armatimonadota bacterium]